MGCLSSKSVEERPSSNRVGNHVASGRVSKAKSVDSGISLSEEDKERKSSAKDEVIANLVGASGTSRSKKGVAFEIPMESASIIKSHPPKRFKSHLEVSRNATIALDPVKTSLEEHEKLRHIVQKQVHAERLREQERHSVVARQKRRDARARKVQERKRKLIEEAENLGDDEMSDIENDQNFNTSEDYNFLEEDDEILNQLQRNISSTDQDLCERSVAGHTECPHDDESHHSVDATDRHSSDCGF